MTERCFSTEDFERILRLPGDAPERRHLGSCPRCRTRLLTYQEFLNDRSVPTGADPQEAGARLRVAFREAAGAGDEPSPAVFPAAKGPVAARLSRWVGNLTRNLGRAPILVPAAAAVLLAAGLYVGYEQIRENVGSDQLRGPTSSGEAELISIPLNAPHLRDTIAVELSWRAIPEISSYDIVIMGDGLEDLLRLRSVHDTTCVVPWADLHPRPAPGTVLGWQVLGLRDGATAARSPIGTIRVP